jgi:hypothetical protein
MILYCRVVFTMTGNGLQPPKGGVLEALHSQPGKNFDESTKLDLTTEPPLFDSAVICYFS